MKFIATCALLFSFGAMACSSYEAQFSSVVKEVVKDSSNPYACKIKLDINLSRGNQSWRSSQVCPLDIDEVVGQSIITRRCDLKAGDAVSGYIVMTDGTLELE